MSGCVSEHVIPNTFEFVSPQKKLSSRGPNVISIAYLESSCTSGCFKTTTAEIGQPKKELTHYDWEKPARIPVKFWNFFCPHPRVGLNKLVSKRPCKANPSPLKAKFGQI